MQHGDISSEVPQRILVVWEDTLADVPDRLRTVESVARVAHRWERAVRCWHARPLARGRCWQVSNQLGVQLQVVTFLGDGFAEALERRLDDGGWPVRGTVEAYDNPGALGRELAGRQDVLQVVDGQENRFLHYGRRGKNEL